MMKKITKSILLALIAVSTISCSKDPVNPDPTPSNPSELKDFTTLPFKEFYSDAADEVIQMMPVILGQLDKGVFAEIPTLNNIMGLSIKKTYNGKSGNSANSFIYASQGEKFYVNEAFFKPSFDNFTIDLDTTTSDIETSIKTILTTLPAGYYKIADAAEKEWELANLDLSKMNVPFLSGTAIHKISTIDTSIKIDFNSQTISASTYKYTIESDANLFKKINITIENTITINKNLGVMQQCMKLTRLKVAGKDILDELNVHSLNFRIIKK